MSPRMALTTACTDSPSKLKVAAPELAPARCGGGAAAASRLMTWPVPRWICGCGPRASVVGSAPCAAPATAPSLPLRTTGTKRSPSRWTVGVGTLAHAASNPASTAARRTAGLAFMRGILGVVLLLLLLLLRLGAQLGAAGLDPAADRVHLRFRRGLGGVGRGLRLRGSAGNGGGPGGSRHRRIGLPHDGRFDLGRFGPRLRPRRRGDCGRRLAPGAVEGAQVQRPLPLRS